MADLKNLENLNDLESLEPKDIIDTKQQGLSLVLNNKSCRLTLINRINPNMIGYSRFDYSTRDFTKPHFEKGSLSNYYGMAIIRDSDKKFGEYSQLLNEAEL